VKLKYCPDRDLLKRLVNNGLDDTELDEIEQHVDCPNWFFTIELVDGVDFLSFVRCRTDRPAPGPETKQYLGPPSRPSAGGLKLTHDVVGDTETFDGKRVNEGHGVRPHRGFGLSPAVLARLRIALLQLGGDCRPP
jgi:hypothetical protein